MKTFQQFLEQSDIDSARAEAKKRSLQRMKDAEKKAGAEKKLNDLRDMRSKMQGRIDRNTEVSDENSERLDALENPKDDSTPNADAVGDAVKGIGNSLSQKRQEMQQALKQKKQMQNKQKMMRKQQQLEKQKLQKMKQLNIAPTM